MSKRTTETFRIETDLDGLLKLLGESFYTSIDAFIRELLQNCHDGIVLRTREHPDHPGRISISIDPEAMKITFTDNGIGMNAADIRNFLSVIGASSKRADRSPEAFRASAGDLIGQFGIGLLSAFVVSLRIRVITRKEGFEALSWENAGSSDCTLSPAVRKDAGTDVELFIREEYSFVLDEEYLREAIVRHANLLPFPIILNGEGPVNAVHAPWDTAVWHDPKGREKACRTFVEKNSTDLALDIIPFDFVGGLRAKGVLYISDQRTPDFGAKGVVDVYVRRMFVKNGETALLPPWAKFVRGVVESPDLKPTASRDSIKVDDDATIELRTLLGELVIERLQYLAAHEPERFSKINRWHHYHLKAMACFHKEFFARIAELLLFSTNRGERSLGECLAIARDAAKPGDTPKLHFFLDPGAAAQFHRLADADNGLVLDVGKGCDEELLRTFAERNPEKVNLVRIDTADSPHFFTRLNDADAERYRKLEIALEGRVHRVFGIPILAQTRSFRPEDLPAMILRDQRDEVDVMMRRAMEHPEFNDLAKAVALDVSGKERPRMLHLMLNAENPLIQYLADWPQREKENLTAGLGENFTSSIMTGLFCTAIVSSHTLMTRDIAEMVSSACSWMLEGNVLVQSRLAAVTAENEQLRESTFNSDLMPGSRTMAQAGGVC